MKKFLLLTLILISNFTFSQNNFEYTKEDGLTPKALVTEVPGINQADIYRNALGWIKETYKNPDFVIKSTIENNKIRFEGVSKNAYCLKVFGINSCDDISYLIDLEFKDGKYRFIPISLKYYNKPTKGTPEILWGWRNFYLDDTSPYYKKKGDINVAGKNSIPFITKALNELNSSLNSYILTDSSNKLNADW